MIPASRSRVLFLFEASPVIGAGHASRSLALAGALGADCEIGLAVNRSALPLLGDRSRDVVAVFEDGQPASILTALSSDGVAVPDMVVIDHYTLAREEERMLRGRGAKVVVIDDLADRAHDCDVLIDSNPARSGGDYEELVPEACRLLLGSDYALLRSEFRVARSAGRTESGSTGGPRRILVSLGATDPCNATARVLDALSEVRSPIEVSVILGKGAPHAEAVAQMSKRLSYPVRLMIAPDRIATIYMQHDLAIGAPATSALERACIGLPSLLIETAGNQRALGAALDVAGAARLLGTVDDLDASAIAAAVDRLADDAGQRSKMRAAGHALVDGRGALRVAANLRPRFATRDGVPLTGRRLRREDAAEILAWQCAPGARRYSRNPAPPSEAEHGEWISRRLSAIVPVTEILTLGGRPVAMARLDPRDDHLEVSVLVAPDVQGRGIGEAAVLYIEAFASGVKTVAFVHPQNVASLKLFRNCGYGQRVERQLVLLESMDAAGSHST